MSFEVAVLWSILRAVLAATLAAAVADRLVAFVADRDRRGFAWRLAVVAAPLAAPVLLIGYAWRPLFAAWLDEPVLREAIGAGLLAARVAPAAALVAALVRPRDRDVEHSLEALVRPRFTVRERLRGGLARLPVPSFVLAFVLALQDFELAGLLALPAWTVWLHDAQVGGGVRAVETLSRALPIAALQLAALVVGWRAFVTRRDVDAPRATAPLAGSPSSRRVGVGWATVAVLAIVGWPAWVLLSQAAGASWSLVVDRAAVGAELVATFAVAVPTAWAAALVARALVGRPWLALACTAPGLVGPLPLALAGGALLAGVGGGVLYDTPLGLVVVLLLWLLPYAFVLELAIGGRAAPPAAHCARLAGSRVRELVWTYVSGPAVARFALLVAWTWFELTASSLLAPVGSTPLAARLYNLAHYGQSAGLAALVVTCGGVCLGVVATVALVARRWPRFGEAL